jgi:hypothetical protein
LLSLSEKAEQTIFRNKQTALLKAPSVNRAGGGQCRTRQINLWSELITIQTPSEFSSAT